jgi:signal transduction histidine kinase
VNLYYTSLVNEKIITGAKPRWGGGKSFYLGIGTLGILSSVLILSLIVWQSAQDRRERIEREEEALSRMAQVVASETANTFSRIRLFFEAADLWLAKNSNDDPRTDSGFIQLANSFRATDRGGIDIGIISETGDLYYIPSASSRPLANVGGKDYFAKQSSPSSRGFYIGAPERDPTKTLWRVPVSYPLSTHNAGMTVIVAFIEMSLLESLYDSIRPKPNGSVLLTRRDGIILARIPFEESILGTSVIAGKSGWAKMIDAAPTGIWTRKTPVTDNEERIVAYTALDSPALVISVSSRLGDVLAVWKSSLWWRILIAVLMLVAIGSISFRLLRALGRLESMQAELRSKLALLRRSDATKDKLFSLIAHDLRGPIGGMSNLLETMATDHGDMKRETLDEFIGALRLTSWNTYQLLENLLSWSRSERGEMPFHPERLLLAPLIAASEEIFALSVTDKELSIRTEVESELEVRMDAELGKVIFRNLISNAVKFTARGGDILISARHEAGGVRIIVRDEGIGMDSEQQAALFDLSAVRSRAGTANERGSGFGLVLCKEILELHGGSIEASSEAGKGSSFSVFFPD